MAPNWSDLSDHLLTLITDKLILIKDFIRFGATCRTWNAVFSENIDRLPRQPPLLMIPTKITHSQHSRKFYNIFDKIVFDLPIPVSQRLHCRGSSFGWLFTVEESLAVRLLNPFLSFYNEIHLPSVNSLEVNYPRNDLFKAVLSANPTLTSNFVIMVVHGANGRLGFLKPGDRMWTSMEWGGNGYEDIISYEGELYAVNFMGGVVTCDFSSPQPELIEVAPSLPEEYWTEKKYIVEFLGELLLVRRVVEFIGQDDIDEDEEQNEDVEDREEDWAYVTVGFQVFILDRMEAKWVEVKGIGGHMLFLGDNTSFCLLASDFPGGKPNCIYFTDDRREAYFSPPYGPHDIGVFNLKDMSFEPHYVMESPMIMPAPIWVEPTVQAPYKKVLEQKNSSNASIQTQIDQLKEDMKELKKLFAVSRSTVETQMQSSTDPGSSSKVSYDSLHQAALLPDPQTAQTRTSSCKLMNIYQKSTCIAFGRVVGVSQDDPGCYKIIVDEILEGNIDLLNGEGTFADLTSGDVIEWPQFRTESYSISN